jgi:hypothetical protein
VCLLAAKPDVQLPAPQFPSRTALIGLNSYIGANRDGRSARYIEHMPNERDASRAIDQVANTGSQPLDRAMAFCAKYGLHVPIMLAPMAGACPIS